jgi:hypothetical protein
MNLQDLSFSDLIAIREDLVCQVKYELQKLDDDDNEGYEILP